MLRTEAPLAAGTVAVAAVDALVGLGPLEPLLRDPAISDVLVNADGVVWVERGGELAATTVRFDPPDAVVAAVERVIGPLGLRLDRARPAVDARLADGSRLHAIIPPASVDGPVVAVRRFTEAVPDLAALIEAGSIDDDGAAVLRSAVTGRRNLLVVGGTGTGKTTLLNALSKEIPDDERLVTVEDAAELRLSGHVVRLEARPANSEGVGEITLRTLVRHALRLRPDRLIVGEVRGPEALDMIQAMSTGHDGSMSTMHANGPEEALWRLETLALSGAVRVAEATVRRQIRSAVDLVVEVRRRSGRRVVSSIVAVADDRIEAVWRC
jgi:pilus assembly protein CpaF